MARGDANWCRGCEIPGDKRINLPSDWKEGDPLPKDLTIHSTERDPRRFAFRGVDYAQDRVYFSD